MTAPADSKGHEWMTYGETDRDWIEPYASRINPFAGRDDGIHNGPKCKHCGYGYCWHCHDSPPTPCKEAQ
jgi:hypothetical protein